MQDISGPDFVRSANTHGFNHHICQFIRQTGAHFRSYLGPGCRKSKPPCILPPAMGCFSRFLYTLRLHGKERLKPWILEIRNPVWSVRPPNGDLMSGFPNLADSCCPIAETLPARKRFIFNYLHLHCIVFC